MDEQLIFKSDIFTVEVFKTLIQNRCGEVLFTHTHIDIYIYIYIKEAITSKKIYIKKKN